MSENAGISHKSRKPYTCDELDEKIARYYVEHPAASEKDVATGIHAKYPTVKNRINRLHREGILVKQTHIRKWPKLGFHFRYRIDVHLNQEALRDKGGSPLLATLAPGKELKDWEGMAHYIMHDLVSFVAGRDKTITQQKFQASDLLVQNVTIVLGQPADLSVTVRAKHPEAILGFVINGLREMRGVRMTSTATEAWSYVDFDF